MNRNLTKTILEQGGAITPLLISTVDSKGLGLMNPSIFKDGDRLRCILRNVNYTLYHAEKGQTFNNRFGPLAYLNPENDIHLRTTNFLLELNPDLSMKEYFLIDTSKLDKEPLWEFVGLEDARLVRWDGKLYGIGVRRDTTTDGQGRMEYSELILNKTEVRERMRYRIEPPKDPKSYCEKNWMPITDMPHHFVKWSNPTEVVKVDLSTRTSETIYLGKEAIQELPDLRGSSQVIPWQDKRIALVHDCDLFKNRMGQKDATYLHRFIVWDQDWNIIRITNPFSFMGGEIEFCCGLTEHQGNYLVSFGFQDNAAFILTIPEKYMSTLLEFDTDGFNWGENIAYLSQIIEKEITENKIYEKHQKVQQGDTVVDIGSNVGAFAFSILKRKPARIVCVEPSRKLYEVLKKNLSNSNSTATTFINKAIWTSTQEKAEPTAEFIVYANREGAPISTITFKEFLEDCSLEKIDFLKVDCEGGEYAIFTEENKNFLTTKVRHIVGEWHLWGIPEGAKKFNNFARLYLKGNKNYHAYDRTGAEITKEILSEEFIDQLWKRLDHKSQIMIYLTNHE